LADYEIVDVADSSGAAGKLVVDIAAVDVDIVVGVDIVAVD
jgi:hypothetical protein